MAGVVVNTPGSAPHGDSYYDGMAGETKYKWPDGQYRSTPPPSSVTANPQPSNPPPSMYQDPNTGNVFQWNPSAGGNGWQTFSTGTQGMAAAQQAGTAAGGGSKPAFDPYAAYARAASAVNGASAPAVPHQTDADRTAADAATFGRAKDRIGQATLGLLKSIRNQMASRGISGAGSGLEADAIAKGLTGQAGQLGDVVRDQAVEGLDHKYAIDAANYQGDITQRGQDLAAQQAKQDSILALVRAAQGAY